MGLIEESVRAAEIKRAELEGREPDFENPAGIAGIVLNPGESVVGDYVGDKADVVAEPEPEVVDYNILTVDELKAILDERGLAVSGTKDELVERLTDDDNE